MLLVTLVLVWLDIGVLRRTRGDLPVSVVHLTEDQLSTFAVDGFLRLRPAVDPKVHRQIALNANLLRKVGNNVFPLARELEAIIYSPVVRGALEDILGEGYSLHRHRHLHVSNEIGQDWHKDSFWGTRRMRSHRPRWVMLMYYPHPQRTSDAMGPTAVASGSQYYTLDHEAGDIRKFKIGEDRNTTVWSYLRSVVRQSALMDPWRERFEHMNQGTLGELEPAFSEDRLTCDAGEVVLIHYNLLHRGTRRKLPSAPTRLMFKLQFYRTATNAGLLTSGGAVPWRLADPVADDMLLWMQGAALTARGLAAPSELGRTLRGNRERLKGRAAYAAGHFARVSSQPGSPSVADGASVVRVLAGALCGDREAVRRAATFGLIAAGSVALPAVVHAFERCGPATRKYALFALGEIGDHSNSSMRVLREAVAAPSGRSYEAMLEKSTALFALGLVGEHAFSQGRPHVALAPFDAIFEAAIAADGSEGFDKSEIWHDPATKNLLREEAVLALSLLCTQAPKTVLQERGGDYGLLRALQTWTGDEPDRYVRGYAYEVLHSLAIGSGEPASHVLAVLLSAMRSDAVDEDDRRTIEAWLVNPQPAFEGGQGGIPPPLLLRRLLNRLWCPRTNADSEY